MSPHKQIAIDEEGFLLLGEIRVSDPEFARQVFMKLKKNETGAWVSQVQGQDYFIEAFDEVLLAQQITKDAEGWRIVLPYHLELPFNLNSLRLDEWDRFHGRTGNDLPFVMNRKAQAEFFNLLDEYSDDSITSEGIELAVPTLWNSSNQEIQNKQFWNSRYQESPAPKWELNQASPLFVDIAPRLKLPKSRVLVLGCGSGNDAAYFAELGHLVTAVDFSEEAISQAKNKYSHLKNIKWSVADAFQLPSDFRQSFDLVIEHTFYCAVPPTQREKVVKVWLQALAPGGHLLGVFFAMDKYSGPPFGGSEWELRQRLKKHFQFIFWGRSPLSVPDRLGKEFLVYALKK